MPVKLNNFQEASTINQTDYVVGYNSTAPGGERRWSMRFLEMWLYGQLHWKIMPIGTILPYASNDIPSGWVLCHGQAISRGTYSELFAKIGVTYGVGDSVNTFNVPDLRGEFLRGFDPNRGVDPGRTLGSRQADELRSHTHNVNNQTGIGPQWIAFTRQDLSPGGASDQTGYPNGGQRTYSAQGNDRIFNIVATGGAETRPRNVAVNYIIRHGGPDVVRLF